MPCHSALSKSGCFLISTLNNSPMLLRPYHDGKESVTLRLETTDKNGVHSIQFAGTSTTRTCAPTSAASVPSPRARPLRRLEAQRTLCPWRRSHGGRQRHGAGGPPRCVVGLPAARVVCCCMTELRCQTPCCACSLLLFDTQSKLVAG